MNKYTGVDSNGNSIVGDNSDYDYYTYRLQYASSKTWPVTIRVAKGGYKYLESEDVRLYSTNGYKTPPEDADDADCGLGIFNPTAGSCEFQLLSAINYLPLMSLSNIDSTSMSFMIYTDTTTKYTTDITGTAFYVYEDNGKLYVQYK